MSAQQTSVISLHPSPVAPRALDVRDILLALGGKADSWIWCVRYLDWLGDGGEDLCRKVEAAGSSGVWLGHADLLNQVRGIYQTIEGQFLAFPRSIAAGSVEPTDLDLRAFPSNRAELAIVAVDGGFFEVFAKNPDLLAPLRKLENVRDENAAAYF